MASRAELCAYEMRLKPVVYVMPSMLALPTERSIRGPLSNKYIIYQTKTKETSTLQIKQFAYNIDKNSRTRLLFFAGQIIHPRMCKLQTYIVSGFLS